MNLSSIPTRVARFSSLILSILYGFPFVTYQRGFNISFYIYTSIFLSFTSVTKYKYRLTGGRCLWLSAQLGRPLEACTKFRRDTARKAREVVD